jgi:hypothetical protein
MNKEVDQDKNVRPAADEGEYTSPRIETVITPTDLEREVHYAGTTDGASLGQVP